MKDNFSVRHEFVEFIPSVLEERVIYVSIPYATTVHSCFCGCGNKVVTPLAPKRWKLGFNGETISLRPSIGNWSFPCESHYWITNNSIEWAGKWTQKQIEAGRAREDRADEEYFESMKPSMSEIPEVELSNIIKEPMPRGKIAPEDEISTGIWSKFRNWVRSKFRF